MAEAEKPAATPTTLLSCGTPEEKGEELEQAVAPACSEPSLSLVMRSELEDRQQKRGTQMGYDVGIEWSGRCEALAGQLVRCHMELQEL